MRKESFPIKEENLRKLIRIFSEKGKRISADKDRYVYVNLSMTRLQMIWVLPKLLYGMGAAEQANAREIAITWGKNPGFISLIDAMGIGHLSLNQECRKHIGGFFKAVFKTMYFIMADGTGDGLKRLRILDLPAGRAIYEDILRTSELSTIKSARNRICIKKIFHILWMLYALDAHLKTHPPVFCVVDDIAYHEGIIIALFQKHGATVYNENIVGDGKVWLDEGMRTVRWGERRCQILHTMIDKAGKEDVARAEEMLEKRFQGKNGRDIDRGAFRDKEVLGRAELMEKFGLQSNKKNAVIMAHTFTDAIFNYGDICYRDYYDWIENTLKIAQEIDEVNWILKPHPTRRAYHESTDSIENMYERYRRPHIAFMSDNVSAESIRYIADVIITVGGNAGAEFSCVGVPAVILGKPYYRGFGYTIEPGGRDEYEALLHHLDRVERLTDAQIETAKKVFYTNTKETAVPKLFSDELYEILRKQDRRMSDEYALQVFEGDEGTEKYNDDAMDELIEYFKKHEYSESEYYQRGMSRAR